MAGGWWKEALRLALLLSVAAGIGWYLGALLPALLAAAAVQLVLWSWQLWRMARWLRTPENEPPRAGGIWGAFFKRIRRFAQHDQEQRVRLQTAVTYLRDSFAALKDGAVLVDPGGGIEWCNEAAERLLGLEYPRDRTLSVLEQVESKAFRKYFEDGNYLEPLVTGSPLKPNRRIQFEVTRFGRGNRLVLARDVTRETLLEKMRRDFVANVSHELRTPLTVITGYLHTFKDYSLKEMGEAPEQFERPLEQMQQQAERMETLLRDLLWLSQIEATDAQGEQEQVSMAELIQEVCQPVSAAHRDRELELRLESDEYVLGNYKQLYSAVSNLVVNAFKYGEGRVVVEWRRRGPELCFGVSDQGPGIEKRHLPRLTERFYRIDKSRSQETGGTGLGLAIVKHVLAVHGAKLEIDSEPGEGSTFRCVFPDLLRASPSLG